MARNDNTQRRSAFHYMFGGLLKHPVAITFATVLTVVSAILMVVPLMILGDAIDELEASMAITPTFMSFVITIVILTLIYMVMYFGVGYVWAYVTLAWERDARQEFFEKLQEFSMTFHDEIDSKRMLSVAMQDISWIRFSMNPALRNLINGLASFALTGILLAFIDRTETLVGFFTLNGTAFVAILHLISSITMSGVSFAIVDLTAGLSSTLMSFSYPVPMFTLIMLVGSPFYLYFAYRYANQIEPVRRRRSETMEYLTSISQSVFQGIEVVRAFGREDTEERKFQRIAENYENVVAREGRLAAFYIPALVLIGMTTVAFLYGSFAALNGLMSRGALIQVLTLLLSVAGINYMIPRMLLMLRGGYVNAQRIVNILNYQDPLVEPEATPEVDWSGDIVFDNVSFVYGRNNESRSHYALKDFSLTIPGGSRVAVIGGPGGGKSTLLKLLLRLYDPTEGTVSVGGVDLREVPTKVVRDNVGLVEQDIFLFRMTIRENISFGRPNATDEEVIEAAKRAQAHEFIVKLPNGYDTMIGERGMTLSGGQRQRLAIARALIQDPKILLLDDSVSAVDAHTEFLMRKALDEVMKERTSITVTQRLRTLIESDFIVILDKGRLIAAGSHEDLLRTSEHYRRIFERLPGAERILASVAFTGGAQ